MADVKGSQTEKNLITSFAGESQARNRYSYFSSQARKEGFVQIANIFEETANQEREHAKRFFGQLKGGDVTVQAPFPAGVVGTTAENLKAAAEGEHYEWTEMYPEFARIAREEGFEAAAQIWEAVSIAEKQHEKRYWSGAASIAGTCTKVLKPLRCALHALIPGPTMSCSPRTGKRAWFHLYT
jgi:rubrerythrin